jgi:hypothetical protein
VGREVGAVKKNVFEGNAVARQVMVETLYHTAGIVPIRSSSQNVSVTLASLPPGEARAMKRKFRKMWRAAVRRELAAATKARRHVELTETYGLGAPEPTKTQRSMRKAIVLTTVMRASDRLLRAASDAVTGEHE